MEHNKYDDGRIKKNKIKYFSSSKISAKVQKNEETSEIKMQKDILENYLDHCFIPVLASKLKIFSHILLDQRVQH